MSDYFTDQEEFIESFVRDGELALEGEGFGEDPFGEQFGDSFGDPFGGADGEGDQFFKKALKGVGGFLKKSGLPGILGKFAPVAGRIAGGMFGGPIGAQIGGRIGGMLGEEEGFDFEDELQGEDENEAEILQEDRPQAFGLDGLTDSLAEELAAEAASAASDSEASALLGGVTIHIVSPAPVSVRRVSPEIVRSASRLGRFLRGRARTRQLVKVIPTIERRAVKDLTKRAQNGGKITPAIARKAMAKATVQTLRTPKAAAKGLANNAAKRQRLNKPAIARAER